MVQLVLSIGSSRCTLSSSDLEKHPDSLLYSISTTAGRDGSSNNSSSSSSSSSQPPATGTAIKKENLQCSSSCITIKLDDLPNNPLTGWPEALELIPPMYREGHIPVALLEQQLNKWQQAAAGNGSSSSSSDSGLNLYHRLADLLAFLNLPGPVYKWLPITDIELKHASSLAFFHQCIASEAVEKIMSYKPYLSAYGLHPTCLTFLITTLPPGSSGFSLQVQVVQTNSLERIAAQLAASGTKQGCWSQNACQFCFETVKPSLNNGYSEAITLPQQGEPMCTFVYDNIKDNAVGVSHPVFGAPLVRALAAALSGTPYIGSHCNVDVKCTSESKAPEVPLWIVKW